MRNEETITAALKKRQNNFSIISKERENHKKGPEHLAGYNREIEPTGQRYREMLIAVF
jgi:hypothetical protein